MARPSLSQGDVRRELSHLRKCAQDLQTKFTPFGPRRLAKRLLQAVDCLNHIFDRLLEEAEALPADGGTQADVHEGIDQAKKLVSSACSEMHSLYLAYLVPANDRSCPVELLVGLRNELCAMCELKSHEVTFCLSEKCEYNNEYTLAPDPVHAVAGIFQDASHLLPEEIQAEIQAGRRVVIVVSYPMAEGRHALLHPMLLHEISHAADFHLKISSRVHEEILSPALLSTLQGDGLAIDEDHEDDTTFFVGCNTFLLKWAREICSDLIATILYGPSPLFALRQVSDQRGLLRRCTVTHPDSILRLSVMLDVLEQTRFFARREPGDSQEPVSVFEKWLLEYLEEVEAHSTEQCVYDDPRLQIVREVVTAKRTAVIARARDLFTLREYQLSDEFLDLVEKLRDGVPPDRARGGLATLGDILNAGWFVYLKHGEYPFECLTPESDEEADRCYEALNELVLKGIENTYLLSKAGHSALQPLLELDSAKIPEVSVVGTERKRLCNTAMSDGTLVVTPLLSKAQIGGASINVRLGSHFLVPKAADVPSFSVRALDEEAIRRSQSYMVRALGDEVVLHPHQLILGHTLEYIGLPDDMCGMVLSRSRYGRLGLVVATATFVHPGWKGCLTLELANYGQVPIRLRCGTPIAQIVFSRCAQDSAPRKCPKDRAPFPIRPVITPITASEDDAFLDGLWQALNGE